MPRGSSQESFIERVTRRLAELRQRAGLTHEMMAERLGIDPRNVQKAESAANMKLETIEHYARALEMSPDDLLIALGTGDIVRPSAPYAAPKPRPDAALAERKPRGRPRS